MCAHDGRKSGVRWLLDPSPPWWRRDSPVVCARSHRGRFVAMIGGRGVRTRHDHFSRPPTKADVLDDYQPRFYNDFHMSLPAPDKATA